MRIWCNLSDTSYPHERHSSSSRRAVRPGFNTTCRVHQQSFSRVPSPGMRRAYHMALFSAHMGEGNLRRHVERVLEGHLTRAQAVCRPFYAKDEHHLFVGACVGRVASRGVNILAGQARNARLSVSRSRLRARTPSARCCREQFSTPGTVGTDGAGPPSRRRRQRRHTVSH